MSHRSRKTGLPLLNDGQQNLWDVPLTFWQWQRVSNGFLKFGQDRGLSYFVMKF